MIVIIALIVPIFATAGKQLDCSDHHWVGQSIDNCHVERHEHYDDAVFVQHAHITWSAADLLSGRYDFVPAIFRFEAFLHHLDLVWLEYFFEKPFKPPRN
jgi:hypothetical protein